MKSSSTEQHSSVFGSEIPGHQLQTQEETGGEHDETGKSISQPDTRVQLWNEIC